MVVLPDPMSLLVTTIKAVQAQVKLAQANKKQCQLLADRLGHLLHILPNTAQERARVHGQRFSDALNDCDQTAQACLKHINSYVGQKWYMRLYRAGNDNQLFSELNHKIDLSQQLLTASLSMHQVLAQQDNQAWQKQMVAAQQQDQQEIKHLLAQVEQLMQAKLKENITKLPSTEQTILQAAQSQTLKNHLYQHSQTAADPTYTVDPKLCLDMTDLIFQQLIAKGSFASVYGGVWQNESVAIKKVNTLNDATRGELIREVKIMGRLRHPNITPFYGACLDPGFECLVMKRMDQGTLTEYLHKNPCLTFTQQQALISGLLQGVKYLHSQDIIHRDLKAANILVHQHQLYLNDFGLAKLKYSLSVKQVNTLPTYDISCAPELLRAENITEKADIYSVGWLLWHILSGKPWPSVSQTKVYPSLSTIPAAYRVVIEQCWHADPKQRPDAKALLQHCQAIQPLAAEALDILFTQAQAAEASSDYLTARDLFAQAAAHDHAKSAYSLGMLYANRRLQLDPQMMLHYLTQAAEGNYYRAQYNLARVYEKGELIAADPIKAVTLYQKTVDNMQTPAEIKAAAQQKLQTLAVDPHKKNIEGFKFKNN